MDMKIKLLGFAAIGVALLGSVVGITESHGTQANQPPLTGAMSEFNLHKAPEPVPEADFFDADNHKLDLSAFRGKLVLVNLWATWCAPCVHEMPSLDRLASQRQNTDFAVVTISQDRQGEKAVDGFFTKNGIKALPRYVDPQSDVSRALNVRGLPTTLLMDRDGNELGRFEGVAEWDGPDAQKLIDWFLQNAAPAPLRKASAN
jgi:thiol-disulfide isomerase/thioredoxin